MTPIKLYEQALARPDFEKDPAQARIVDALQRLYDELIAAPEEKFHKAAKPQSYSVMDTKQRAWVRMLTSIIDRLGGEAATASKPIKGLYLWGGVGRGKTYLMDLFFDSLPFNGKLRLHFHRFMKRVHIDLQSLQGVKNPLDLIAEQIAGEAGIICFDEFFVSDIADAMILGELFKSLFQRGVVLVATSNIPPDQLYENGLQRARFMPAIEAVKANVEIMEIESRTDYRLRALERAEIFHYPLDQAAERNLSAYFSKLTLDHSDRSNLIEIEGRNIEIRRVADDVLWAEFDQLCGGPRSQRDYIEIAKLYHAVLLSNLPQLKEADNDRARRFVYLVDEFYDRGVKLIISAQVPIESIYIGHQLQFEFQRTTSRLLEMQSHDYLEREHRLG